jgi:catechol-2,3-dioxygenase
MNKSNHCITAITEISLRVHNLDIMRKFYEEVLGLEVIQEFDDHSGRCVFYAIGDGDHRDGQKMALFQETYKSWIERDRSSRINVKQSTLHHFAFNIPPEDFESEKRRLEQLGIQILRSGTAPWMRARMFYFADPEGNIIEFRRDDETEATHD